MDKISEALIFCDDNSVSGNETALNEMAMSCFYG